MRKLIRNLEDAESREFWNNLERCVAVAVKKWPDWLHDAFESAGDSPVGGSLVDGGVVDREGVRCEK